MTTVNEAPATSAPQEPLQGIGVCPGLVAGPVALMGAPPRLPAERPTVTDAEAEAEAAVAALNLTAEDLERRAAVTAIPGAAEVLEATAMIARDPSLEEAIRSATAEGSPGAWAVDRAIAEAQRLYPDHRIDSVNDVGEVTSVADAPEISVQP